MTWDEFFADLQRRHEKGVDIVPYPHPALRHPAVPVKTFGPELENLIQRMFEIMYDRKGVGLAAPQVGLPLQLFVCNHTVELSEGKPGCDYDPKKAMVFINPVIKVKESTNRPAKMVTEMEGCLSMPGIVRQVARPNTVTFKCLDAKNKAKKGEYNGLVARILQHENDHLHGKLFVDLLDEQQKEAIPGWLNYLSGHFEAMQNRKTFKSIEEEKALLLELEKLA